MKKILILPLLIITLAFGIVSGQNEEGGIILRPTAAPDMPITLTNTTASNVVINTTNLTNISGDGVLNGKGIGTVTLWDRSIYERQPKSVNLPNAKEMFPTGLEVPKPDLDRPITDPWDDLKGGYACEGILNSPYYFQKLKLGEEFTPDITFRNVGTETWDFNVDLMMYTGDRLEKDEKYLYDIGKDFKNSENKNDRIVKPGGSIRIQIPMRAPTEKYHEDNKYYAAYTLVRNWNKARLEYKDTTRYGWDALHDGQWGYGDQEAMFCPVYFYIYVPD